jgi:hypothetical protein
MAHLDFGYALGPLANWGDFERRVATIAVQACLLEPGDDRRRIRLRNVLLAGELDKLANDSLKNPETAQMLAAITADVIADLPSIAKRLSSKNYLKTLSFDLSEKKSKSGSNVRGILSVGLIVKTAHQAAHPGVEQRFGSDQAKKKISAQYKKNALFNRNESDLKNAWTRNRPIAHLSAALLQYVSDRQLKRFRTAERDIWRNDIVEFLEHANYFQHYIRTLSWQPKLRFPYDLLELPAELDLGRREPKGGLEDFERLIK